MSYIELPVMGRHPLRLGSILKLICVSGYDSTMIVLFECTQKGPSGSEQERCGMSLKSSLQPEIWPQSFGE